MAFLIEFSSLSKILCIGDGGAKSITTEVYASKFRQVNDFANGFCLAVPTGGAI